MNRTATHQTQVQVSKNQWVKYLWVGFAFVLLGILISMSSVSYANNTTYYINNQSGSNCSNGGSGTLSQPWCDFTNVNTTTFQQGDQILLARGAVWNQELHLNGSGTSTNWITVDAYGTGNKPKIQRNSNAEDRTVFMYDSSYWIVKNLEIANAGNGIKVNYTTLGHEGLRFENLYIHNIDLVNSNSPATLDNLYASKGIWIVGKDAPIPSSTQWVLRDLKITNNEIGYTTDPIVVNQITNSENKYSFRNIRIKNNYIHDTKGVIGIRDVTDGKMISNHLDNLATVSLPQGTTGIFQWMTENITYVNNYMNLVPNTDSYDETMIDLEGYVNNTYFHSNYISDTDGPGMEFLQLSSGNPLRDPATDHNTNNYVIGNMFVSNNNYAMKVSDPNGNTVTGSIIDNLYYEPNSGFTTGDFSGFTLSNNKGISSILDIYYAGKDFSATQGQNRWSYQLYNGASYSNLSYDSTNQWWGSSTGYVSRFDELPNSTSSNWVARAWTVPSAGTISIRGRVLKNDIGGGDGVKAKITKNGTVIWPTSGTPQTIAFNDETGVNTNLDSISVEANDVIRFEVNNGGSGNSANDLSSWSPSVAYTSMVGGSETNLAPSATLSVDTTNGTYTKDKAVDGIKNSSTSRWISDSTVEPHWFQLDWASNKTISNVKVWSGSMDGAGWQIYDYKMQYWSGSAWVDITGASVTNNTQDGLSGQYNDLNFTAVTTNKIRMYITDAVNQPSLTNARLLEIEIWGTSGSTTNLAPSATLSVDTTNGTYTKDKAVDEIKNSSTSRWISDSTVEPHWFQLDWASNKTISNVKVWSGSMDGAGWQIYDYKMQYWSGSAWVDITGASVDNNTQDGLSGQYNDLSFTAVTTTKMRMYITDGTSQAGYTNARLLEIEVWGN